MHPIQEKILKVSAKRDLGKMSLRDIGKLVGQADAPQKIKHHLLALQRRGLLEIDRASDTIAPVTSGPIGKSKLIALPILGAANCGPAMILAEQQALGYIHISGKLLVKKRGIFGIKASGHSMNKANINGECIEDGDYVVVDPEYRSIRNGDYVLSVINGAANIKRYFRDGDNKRIILLSESSADIAPIFIHWQDMDEYIVNGKVVQVIKKPKTAWSRLKRFVSSES